MGLFSRLIEKVKSGSTSTQDFAEIEKSLIQSDLGAANAKAIIELAKKMNQKQLWDLPVVDQKGLLVGLLHRHDVS